MSGPRTATSVSAMPRSAIRTCWSMCTHCRYSSPIASIGETIASTVTITPATKSGIRVHGARSARRRCRRRQPCRKKADRDEAAAEHERLERPGAPEVLGREHGTHGAQARRAASPSSRSERSPARRLPERIAPSMCMWPTPARSVHAQWIGPSGRVRSGPKRERPPIPNVAAYAPRVHSSSDQSSSITSIASSARGPKKRASPSSTSRRRSRASRRSAACAFSPARKVQSTPGRPAGGELSYTSRTSWYGANPSPASPSARQNGSS